MRPGGWPGRRPTGSTCTRGVTLALKAMSFRIISTVKSTVKIRFRVSDSLVTWSDWLQCCSESAESKSVTQQSILTDSDEGLVPDLCKDSAYGVFIWILISFTMFPALNVLF